LKRRSPPLKLRSPLRLPLPLLLLPPLPLPLLPPPPPLLLLPPPLLLLPPPPLKPRRSNSSPAFGQKKKPAFGLAFFVHLLRR
jgi:hypothetical protein